jgi:hypothetical protein
MVSGGVPRGLLHGLPRRQARKSMLGSLLLGPATQVTQICPNALLRVRSAIAVSSLQRTTTSKYTEQDFQTTSKSSSGQLSRRLWRRRPRPQRFKHAGKHSFTRATRTQLVTAHGKLRVQTTFIPFIWATVMHRQPRLERVYRRSGVPRCPTITRCMASDV